MPSIAEQVKAFLQPVGWWTHEQAVPPTYYSYDPGTGEYLGSGLCDPSPLEPGVWLLPGHSTFAPLPDTGAAGYVHVWHPDTFWTEVRDRRGEWVYDQGEFRAITTLGAHPELKLEVHDAQYVADANETDPGAVGLIRMWVNDDVIEFRDDPNLPARQVLAAWEAFGETIRPIDVDIETVAERDARLAADDAAVQALIEGRKEESDHA